VEEIDKPGEAVQSTVLSRGGGFRDGHCRQIVHPAGISERLPSGSTTDILAHAYAQCRSNKGAPGVDGQDFADIGAAANAARRGHRHLV